MSAYANVPNTPDVETPSQSIVTGSVSFQPHADVTNLFDTRRAESAAYTFLQSPFATYNLPRMVEVGIRAKF